MPTSEKKSLHPRSISTEAQSFLKSARYRAAKAEMLSAIREAGGRISSVRPPQGGEGPVEFQKFIQDFTADRGRELYFPYVSSGLGAGVFVELLDGSVKYDLISGIGVNFFGHAHPELVSEMVDALSSDVMQGNLQPGIELAEFLRALLSRVGKDSRLRHAWPHCSGTMANETALKVIRQKKFPATRIFAFSDCFAGRSTAMQEITDSPKYREGQPTYGEVTYLPFYSEAKGLEASVEAVTSRMDQSIRENPGKYAALMIELVQGEGGFNYGPREFYTRIFDHAKSKNLAIWADEIQTFGRTGELFAYQTFGLEKYMDVVTVGKLLQACAALYTDEYNPKPGLLAGTFTGSGVALRTGRRVLELLDDGYLGPQGRIVKLSAYFKKSLDRLAEGSCKGFIGERRALGGMVAFTPFTGTLEDVKRVLTRLYDLGVVAFYCGHDPYRIRLLPPFGVMTESDIDSVTALIEQAIREVAK